MYFLLMNETVKFYKLSFTPIIENPFVLNFIQVFNVFIKLYR